jgi:dihydrofolate reductase
VKLTLNTFLSLDGVMQGPGGAEEDRSGGFESGGWLVPHVDDDFGRIVTQWFAEADAILLGRTTYDMMYPYWSAVTDPENAVSTALNTLPKHVVSTTLRHPSWQGSTVISENVVEAVARLKAKPGRELQVHGSCGLAHTLHDAGLIDEYGLLVFPVVVGEGKRLFREGCVPATLSLVDTQVTSGGAVAHIFRPGRALGTGEFVVEDGKEAVRG